MAHTNPPTVDYTLLAKGIEDMREVIAAMVAGVAGVVSDGFTDEQARIIVTGFFAPKSED